MPDNSHNKNIISFEGFEKLSTKQLFEKLTKNPKLASIHDVSGHTLLHHVCIKLKPQLVKTLLLSNTPWYKYSIMNINSQAISKYLYEDFTPLQGTFLHARYNEDADNAYDIAKFLLRKGANPNLTHGLNWPPLNAINHDESFFDIDRRFKLVKLLLDNGADPCFSIDNQWEPLQGNPISILIYNGRQKDQLLDIVKLMARPCNVNITHTHHVDATSPLEMAISQNTPDIARFLVEKGSTVTRELLQMIEERKANYNTSKQNNRSKWEQLLKDIKNASPYDKLLSRNKRNRVAKNMEIIGEDVFPSEGLQKGARYFYNKNDLTKNGKIPRIYDSKLLRNLQKNPLNPSSLWVINPGMQQFSDHLRKF